MSPARFAKNDVIEGIVRIAGKIGVGIPLDDRQPLGDTIIDAALGKLDAARIHLFFFGEQPQQRAIAASDIENAAFWLDHISDEQQIDARRNCVDGLEIVDAGLGRHL